jgi:transposase
MKLHRNAKLSVKGRELLIDRVENAGWSLTKAAEAAGVSDRTARKWLERYRADGSDGLLDRSSAPAVVANRTDERRIEVIAALRRLRMTGAEIAECLGMAASTVSGILTRIGMGRLGRIGLEPAQRYERARPGELLHIDVKKLGRIHGGAGHRFIGHSGGRAAAGRLKDTAGVRRLQVGWEYVHIAIDDATRLAYVEILADEKAATAIGFLRRAVAHYGAHGITVERLITDNGSAYRSTIHAIACRVLDIRHLRTRPTGHRPTAKPSASFVPYSPAGPTARSTAPAPNARPRLRAGSTGTTSDDPTALVQHPTTPRRAQPQAAHRSPQRAEQPARVLQLVHRIASGDPSKGSSRTAHALWAIRLKVGALLGWDGPEAGLGSRLPTLRDRLPLDLRAAPPGPDLDALHFSSLYLLDDEWAAEIANRTIHGIMHIGWVQDGNGGHRGQMAVLVKPNGLLGTAYMATIKLFRHLIVYPAMMGAIERAWRARAGEATPSRA